eukprot:TRINITY_DN34040_c0_g1_i1.p1 TRINITY_DN34040_c0_g1~~TRINITY_DN34040_c0_g1_i1.p1  ORF type:complete len:316 (-),score=19.35 TRINITY_DN34040_c0_g1_i1:204-1034(-)
MGTSLSTQIAHWPTGTRLFVVLYLAVSAGMPTLASMNPRWRLWFVCNFANVVTMRRFHALFLSALYRPLEDLVGMFNAGVELSVVGRALPQHEQALGTTRFISWLTVAAGCTNAAFLALMKVLETRGMVSDARFYRNQGIWPLLVSRTTVQILEGPAVPMKVFGLVEVPSKWYPLSIFVGLSTLNGHVQWETLAGVIFGHAYHALQLENWVLPTRRFAQALERRWLPRVPGFVSSIVGGRWVPADDRPLDDRALERRGRSQRGFVPFSGPGWRLGS